MRHPIEKRALSAIEGVDEHRLADGFSHFLS